MKKIGRLLEKLKGKKVIIMGITEKAFHYFRNLVYCLYREIRVLKRSNHEELYKKINKESGFYDKTSGMSQAKELYSKTVSFTEIERITKLYEIRTGLKISELFIIFSEGKWKGESGYCNYGGPKWGKIAEETIHLKNLILANEWETVEVKIAEIDKLRHNNGFVVDKFKPI